MAASRTDRPKLALGDYLTAYRFRTVTSFQMQRAPCELRAELELGDTFMQSLSFQTPWDGKLYAYATPRAAFYALCRENGFEAGSATTLYFQDWDTKFLLAVETSTADRRQMLTFFLPPDDVRYLLENCCRIPEQRRK